MPSKVQQTFHPRNRKSRTAERRARGIIPSHDKPDSVKRLVRAKRLLSLLLDGTLVAGLSSSQLKELEFSGVRTPEQQKAAWDRVEGLPADSDKMIEEKATRKWEADNGIACYTPPPKEGSTAAPAV